MTSPAPGGEYVDPRAIRNCPEHNAALCFHESAPTPMGAPGWLAETAELIAKRDTLVPPSGIIAHGEPADEFNAAQDELAERLPVAVAALEAVLALAGEWHDPEDDGLPSSALSEDRAWVRAQCAESLTGAIESALRDAQGGQSHEPH